MAGSSSRSRQAFAHLGETWDTVSLYSDSCSQSLWWLEPLSLTPLLENSHRPQRRWSSCCWYFPMLPCEASASSHINSSYPWGKRGVRETQLESGWFGGWAGLIPLPCSQNKENRCLLGKERAWIQILEQCVLWIPLLREKEYGFLSILLNMAKDPELLELMGRLEQLWIRHQWGNVWFLLNIPNRLLTLAR